MKRRLFDIANGDKALTVGLSLGVGTLIGMSITPFLAAVGFLTITAVWCAFWFGFKLQRARERKIVLQISEKMRSQYDDILEQKAAEQFVRGLKAQRPIEDELNTPLANALERRSEQRRG